MSDDHTPTQLAHPDREPPRHPHRYSYNRPPDTDLNALVSNKLLYITLILKQKTKYKRWYVKNYWIQRFSKQNLLETDN